jgi:hypothetical protein
MHFSRFARDVAISLHLIYVRGCRAPNWRFASAGVPGSVEYSMRPRRGLLVLNGIDSPCQRFVRQEVPQQEEEDDD